MATIRSFTEALGVLKRNPLVFAAGALYAAVLLPQRTVSSIGIPFLPRLIQIVTFFVTPFILAGVIALAYEGRHRDTSFSTFKKVGKDRYLRVLAGNLVTFGFTVVFALVLLVVVVFTIGFSVMSMGASSDPGAALASGVGLVALAIVGLIVALFLVIYFFVQFYAVAVVVDDAGVFEGFTKSIAVVKGNLVSALGFSVLSLLVGALIVLPKFVIAAAPVLLSAGLIPGMGEPTTAQSSVPLLSSTLSVIGLVGYSFLATIVMYPFRQTFSVAFYENHSS